MERFENTYPMSSPDGLPSLFEDMYPMEVEVIPCINETVYLVNVDDKEIYKVKVYAKGLEFFIPKGTEKWKPEWREIRFDEYGKRWFFKLDEAKEYVEAYLNEDEVLEEGGDDWWTAMKL
jgi:hypothetical protein